MKNNYILTGIIISLFCFQGQLSAQKTATIKKQPMGITIDGVGDETAWANAASYQITNFLGSTPEDEFDFSASFKLAWNDTALLYLVEANDFDIVPLDAWYADGFELYFKFGSGTATDPNIGDDRPNGFFQVAIRLTNEPATGGYMPDSTRNHAVTVIKDSEDGWTTEGYAAWGQFNNESGNAIVPANGFTFRFDMNGQDNENIVDGEESANLTRGYWSSETHLWDGDFSTSGIVSLSNEVLDPSATGIGKTASESFSVFPNPVKNNMIITGTKVSGINVYDICGKMVLSKRKINSGNISLELLQEGLYIIKFFNNHGDYIGLKKVLKVD